MMENKTILPAVVANCRLSPTYEHEPLWIITMLVVSAISTLTAMIVRKRRARASARPKLLPRAPIPSPPSLAVGGRGRGGGGGDDINRTVCNDDVDNRTK